MAINVRCPKCGGTKVQLSDETRKRGCIYFILLGWVYLLWVMFKWMIGMMIFFCSDWWMAIVHKVAGKGHVWQSKRCFSGRSKIYFCHDCGYNFRA